MRLESYAQEFEDLFLYSLLHDVNKGFYIDVGANDPTDINVTRFFYDRGWSGINIEPIRENCKLLDEMRPRDINLCIGLGSERGEAFLYGDNVMATFSDEIAKSSFGNIKDTDGRKISPKEFQSKIPTPILTLTDVFRNFCPPPPKNQIHFCKIDVEGFEKEVLLGVKDWEEFRPWTFCVEAAFPGTDRPVWDEWEYILLDAGYKLTFAFGINRYYVDSRRGHLAKSDEEIKSFLQQFEIRRMQISPLVEFS